ncbi:hypothetical protein [Pseudomonas aeruginosa]|uniref:hypothetical protein n=1 Tax=Pseudomonas aeruginosa TaxID=287 RepID=UPI001ADF099B|nr:hypothetical protein [Pseudomonas aeruginosa]MDF1652969.1 hypothetical protein [Pseudomonas aeruginosa]
MRTIERRRASVSQGLVMNMQNELMNKMRATVDALPLANLVEAFELTNAKEGAEVPVVRGVLMDALEARDPAAFEAWMDCADPALMDLPSRFFTVAR